MTTAVTYLRVSSADQVQNTSLDDQDERTKKHVAEKGWRLLATFREEGKSAKNDDRPQLKAMLQFCAENEVDYVVALDMSRLSRDTEAYLRIRRTLSNVGTKLSFTSFDPGDSPEGRFIATVSAAAAELENTQRGLKAKHGMLATQRSGGWITCAPIGYRCSRHGRLPSLTATDDAPRVRRAFEAVANGEKSIYEAAKSIGIAKPEAFFRRAVFAGYNEIDGELVKGNWTPIVPLRTWYSVQDRLRHKRQVKRSDFWLRGMLVCDCGHFLTASYSRGRGKLYGYYHCHYCKARHPARATEDKFREWIDGFIASHAKVFADIKKDYVAGARKVLKEAQAEFDRAVEERSGIARKLDALLDLKLAGGITMDEYNSKRAELLQDKALAERDVAMGQMTEADCMSLVDDYEFIISNFTQFLGSVDFGGLMAVARILVGSTITLSRSGELSNRENDCLSCVFCTNEPPEKEMACLTARISKRELRELTYRVRMARKIMENVLEEKP